MTMTLLIFDIDGTLIHPAPFEDAAFTNAFLAVFGIQAIDTDWGTFEHVTDSGLLHELSIRHTGRPPTVVEVQAFRAHYETLLTAELFTNPGVGQALHGATGFWEMARRRPDWSLAFATGNWRSIARLKLDRAGIGHDGIPLSCADDAIPRTDLLRGAIRADQAARNGKPAERIISIGDAEWDVRAAADNGVPFIGVGTRWIDSPNPACRGWITDFHDETNFFEIVDRITNG